MTTPSVRTVTSLADSGAGSLRATIAAAPSGSTIRFASSLANKTITLTSGQIEIPAGRTLTIDGRDARHLKISGNQSSRIFLLNSTSATPSTLTVQNLTLMNGATRDRGGAISTTHQGRLTVENVAFLNNRADQGGGAIFSAFEGTLTVLRSRFVDNVAVAGNDERGAGAIAFWGPRAFTIRHSDFIGNKGINGGAINSLNGKLTIENSRFLNNDTTAATVANGQPNPTLRGYGGAIYTDRASASSEPSGTIRIVGSVFRGNRGRAEGGAAYLYTGRQDQVSIESSSFEGNEVLPLPGGNGGNGGAVVLMSNELNQGLTIQESSFTGNTASGQGGGLWMMKAPTTITNSTFSGNRVTGTGFSNVGGGMALYGPTTLTNSTIALNTAGWVAGGISADGSTVTARNTIFFNNTAANGGNDWKIQQHTNRELGSGGGNIQFPDMLSNQFNRFNDSRATASIRVIDPRLGPLQDNGGNGLTHGLLTGSPALNAGVTGTGIPTVDGRRARRDSRPDGGAVESITPVTFNGTTTSDRLAATTAADTLLGNGGDDVLIGRAGADVLTGHAGSDRFVYSAATAAVALTQSRLGAVDRITDLMATLGDRIVLDFDGTFATAELPIAVGNAGLVSGSTLTAAMQAAFADKDQRTSGAQALRAREATFFRWGSRTYLAVNDGTAAFSSAQDMLVDVTGIAMVGTDSTLGSLAVSNYFA